MIKDYISKVVHTIEILIITSISLLNISTIIQISAGLYRNSPAISLYVGFTTYPIKLDPEQAFYILIYQIIFMYLCFKWGELDKINYLEKISKINPK